MKVKYLLSLFIIALAVIAGFGPSAHAADGCSAASFKVSTSLSLEWPPYGIASADFNGDGHLDLAATSNSSNEVVIFKGGAEGFGPQTGFPAGTGPESVAVGDFNGDARPDLLITNNTLGVIAGKVAVLLNDGSGNFGMPIITALTATPSQPVITDLNCLARQFRWANNILTSHEYGYLYSVAILNYRAKHCAMTK